MDIVSCQAINTYIMNVLILTPDRVGSTLLQRYLTVIMQEHGYDKPVVNLHELTNGLVTYYSDQHQQNMVGKPANESEGWGYYQSLDEIMRILDSGDHYKTSRLALYHIQNRKDPIADQIKFYNYLNDNFYIIAAKRYNLFEHGLSWCIKTNSKKFNVYTHGQKGEVFNSLVENGIYVDTESMCRYLDRYLQYNQWCDDHFDVSNYFYYEKDIQDLDGFVRKLNIFPNQEQAKSFEDAYGMSWNDWNSCHYLISDTSNISQSLLSLENHKQQTKLLELPKQTTISSDSQVGAWARSQRTDLSIQDSEFLNKHIQAYENVRQKISDLKDSRKIITGFPIKLHTMMEKASMIRNFPECLTAYNNWCVENNIPDKVIDLEQLKDSVYNELNFWYNKS